MPKENEYEIEESDAERWFYATKGEKAFNVERTHYVASDMIEYSIYDKDGGYIDPNGKEYREIRAAVIKYLEKENRTVQIEVKSGTVVDVRNLPEGLDYEVIDHDVMEE